MAYNTIGDIADRMEEIRKERKKLSDKDKPLKEEYDELKVKAIELLDKSKQIKGGSAKATLTISETDVPIVKDIAKLVQYISRQKYWHLFLAQPLTTPAWREAKGLKGTDLPGTETFIKRDVNHASIKPA